MARIPRLAIVFPGGQPTAEDGRVKIARKSITGMAAYQERWPGEVVLVGRTSYGDGAIGLGGEWVRPEDLPFRTSIAESLGEALEVAEADIVLAPHHPNFSEVLEMQSPAVLVSEVPARDASSPALEEGPDFLTRMRIVAGTARYDWRLRRMARKAAGLQCNGWNSWDAYSKLSPDPLLFYDTRLTLAQVEASLTDVRPISQGGKLRLAFSGRFAPGKGPMYVVRLHDALRAREIPHSLTFVGEGPLGQALHASADSEVDFIAPMDFDSEWVPWVRKNVDVMVLPHIQGDPSGTYLETSGLGVPLLGFDNIALQNLVTRFDLGWTAPLRDIETLADIVQQLVADPSQIADRGKLGQQFMREHHFDAEFNRRIEHLDGVLSASRQ